MIALVIIQVLDEADRILDMGFAKTLNAILEALPPGDKRQNLLFSATQTKNVQQLARLSLRRDQTQYVSVHDKSQVATPRKLEQFYMQVNLPDKLSVLYSFIRTHLKSKMIVFFSSCKEVRFAYETFRQMRPGVPLMALHGKIKQIKRTAIYEDFCQKNEGGNNQSPIKRCEM